MYRYQFAVGVVTVLLFMILNIPTAWSQVTCESLPRWVVLDNSLALNQKHVFCGEWSRNRPKGFHARPDGLNPAAVADFTVQDKANAAGVYTGRWSHQKNPGKHKFSSMFPDNCSTNQVLNSIAYAVAHAVPCPSGAPGWTRCGPNKPQTHLVDGDREKYCGHKDNFTIGFAPPKNGKINTAFPLYE